jgi:hypothetical protein
VTIALPTISSATLERSFAAALRSLWVMRATQELRTKHRCCGTQAGNAWAPAAAAAWIDGDRASIHFQTPASTLPKEDQLPIIAYAITILPSNRKVLLTGRNVIALEDGKHVTFGVVDELKPDEAYRFSVSAVNAAGEGEAVTVPGLPVAKHP